MIETSCTNRHLLNEQENVFFAKKSFIEKKQKIIFGQKQKYALNLQDKNFKVELHLCKNVFLVP